MAPGIASIEGLREDVDETMDNGRKQENLPTILLASVSDSTSTPSFPYLPPPATCPGSPLA